MTTKNFGAGVSAYLDVDGRNFETTVYQASKPVLDSELNQIQDINQARNRSIFQLSQSGWVSSDVLDTSSHVSGIFIPSIVANELKLPPLKALVNGWIISVDNTGGTTNNIVSLGTAPAGGLRTDLVVLEVWRRLLSASPSTVGKSQSARIWRNGNVKIAGADDVSLNFADDILDTNVAAETTKRVQIQYRLRVVQGVDLAAYPTGIADPAVFAFSVPPNAATPDGSVTTFNYTLQSAAGDSGLWRAGDGVPSNALGTVDGYMYALPLCAVFRRNTTAFNRDTNHNGGSGRPDTLTATVINGRDLIDLRTNSSTTGWDLQELLAKNVSLTLDNQLRTEFELTPLGGGSRGHTNLFADEIGPTDNAGAQLIRGGPGKGFDAVCRRFSDRPILETVVVRFVPTDQQGGGATWNDGSVIVIDPTAGTTAFRIHPYGTANYIAAAPSNVAILDVINWAGVDNTDPTVLEGPYDSSFDISVAFEEISGLGTAGPVTLTLGSTALGASQTLYVTLLVSYPGGAEPTAGGLSRTPTGGAQYVPYVFDNATADADPGAGKLRLGSATQNASTVIRADLLDAYGATVTTFLDSFDDSPATVKGSIRLVKSDDLTKWLVFAVSAVATPAGYRNITVTNVASSAASPFTNGDALTLYFDGTDQGVTSSFVLETPAQLPAGSPHLFNALVTDIDSPHREALITYRTLSHSFSQLLGDNGVDYQPSNTVLLFVPERVAATPVPTISNVTTGDAYTGGVTISPDGHLLFVSNQAADWSLGNAPTPGDEISTTFQSLRPLPINSVQVTIYYETRAAQTIREALLGTTLTVIPRYTAPHLYTLVTGSGSLDEGYPFPQQYVQSPGVYPSSAGSFAGDHELDGTGVVSIAEFDAQTGFLQVPTFIPAVPNPQSLTFTRDPGDSDAERRTFYKSVPAGYIPSAFAQPLSDSKRHKNVLPMVAELAADGVIGPKGTLLLLLISRWATFDERNFVGFNLTLAQNFTSASVYRLKGGPLNPRRA